MEGNSLSLLHRGLGVIFTTKIIYMKSVVKKSCGCKTNSAESTVAQCCAKVSIIVAGCHD